MSDKQLITEAKQLSDLMAGGTKPDQTLAYKVYDQLLEQFLQSGALTANPTSNGIDILKKDGTQVHLDKLSLDARIKLCNDPSLLKGSAHNEYPDGTTEELSIRCENGSGKALNKVTLKDGTMLALGPTVPGHADENITFVLPDPKGDSATVLDYFWNPQDRDISLISARQLPKTGPK